MPTPFRVYSAIYRIAEITAAPKTLAYITTPTAAATAFILRAKVTTENNNTNQQLAFSLSSITTLGTPTATTGNILLHCNQGAAALSVVKFDVTASEPTYEDATGDAKGAFVASVPSLLGFDYHPSLHEVVLLGGTVAPAANYGLRILAPAAPVSFDCRILLTWGELGG